MVTLSSDGHLQCLYMGTDPSFFTAPKVDSRDINYNEVDKEMKMLQKVIREVTKTQGMTHGLSPKLIASCIIMLLLMTKLNMR